MLANPSSKIKVQSTPNGDNVLLLPKRAPDSINTVIVFDWKQEFPDPIHFLVPNTKLERFLAYDATQSGKGFSFGDGKTDRYYVDGWKSVEQKLNWTFRTINSRPANYKIIIKYLAPAQSSGGKYAIAIDQLDNIDDVVAKRRYDFEKTVTTDPKGTKPIVEEIGTISLTHGSYSISIVPVVIDKTELMKLLEIQLIPIDKNAIKK